MRMDATIEFKGVDVDVEIEFEPGYFQPGNRRGHPDNWTPDEGEAAEVHSVTLTLGTGRKVDIMRKLDKREMANVQRVCDRWEPDEPDYEPDDDYDDDRDWQDGQDAWERSIGL